MLEPKWTPGPWAAHNNETCWQIDAATDAVVTTQFCYAQETEANARLIAAAPELYEALEAACDTISFIDDNSPEGYGAGKVRVWRQLLAKARGDGQ